MTRRYTLMKAFRQFFARLKRFFSRHKSTWKECSRVRFDDARLYVQGTTPEGDAFEEELQWDDIIRVCFRVGVYVLPDELYLLSEDQHKSYCVDTRVTGGAELFSECLRRNLLDARAACAAGEGEVVFGDLRAKPPAK